MVVDRKKGDPSLNFERLHYTVLTNISCDLAKAWIHKGADITELDDVQFTGNPFI